MHPTTPRLRAAASALLLTALGVACATSGINKGQFNAIGFEEEDQMGKEFQVEVEKEYKILDDKVATAWLDGVGKRVLGAVPSSEVHFEYTFKLVDTPDINAFAIPGGHIYFNKGLIQLAENEAEVAAVMAHEVSHVLARHGTESLTKMYGVQTLTGVLLGENPEAWKKMAADIATGVGFLKNSRSQEDESDRLGLQWLVDAGYDPGGMTRFFQRLEQMTGGDPEGGVGRSLQRMMSSHPLTSDRIRASEERIALLAPPAKPYTVTTPKFEEIRKRLGGPWTPPKAEDKPAK